MAKKRVTREDIAKKTWDKAFKNKVERREFEYEEQVNDFTGLIFHCPNCDEVFHLHIANVRIKGDKDV